MTLSNSSIAKLETCDPQLVKLVMAVAQVSDIVVACGHRDKAAQEAAFKAGTSKAVWGKSAHNTLPSRAVDIYPVEVAKHLGDWGKLPRKDTARLSALQDDLAKTVKRMAGQMAIPIQWGGDWHAIVDKPHFQLPPGDKYDYR